MTQTSHLIDRYYEWLKSKTNWREVNGWVEITTPYLDRHNDYIQIYLKQNNDQYLITDDGYTIEDLAQSGCSLASPKRQALLMTTLNGFGVRLSESSLEVKATEDTFALKKHNLVQAILAVNDLFYIARSNVENFFFEDVALWMDQCDIRYSQRIKLSGKSGLDHLFDFVIPKSKFWPERIIRAINNPTNDNAKNMAFSWVDTKETRPFNSAAFAILNDREKKINESVNDALRSYEITPICWSKRQDYVEQLAA